MTLTARAERVAALRILPTQWEADPEEIHLAVFAGREQGLDGDDLYEFVWTHAHHATGRAALGVLLRLPATDDGEQVDAEHRALRIWRQITADRIADAALNREVPR